MGLNDTPRADRVHIGIFGKRNSGKSSLINALTGQNTSIVSDTAGTTTDPVYKSMELLPLGPVVFIDTPGLDDSGELGRQRIERTNDIIKKCDMALVVCSAQDGITETEKEITAAIEKRHVPYLTVFNKCELGGSGEGLCVSAKTGKNINELKEKLSHLSKPVERPILRDLIKEGDSVILVIPIDSAAPKGRIILPQQQVLREVLDSGAAAICVQPPQLCAVLENMKKAPALVITDSQAFAEVSEIVPQNIKLTSFSILLAKKKANYAQCLDGAKKLKEIKDGDKILISEGCTHHRQCDDIGTVKLPRLIRKYTGAQPSFEFTSGTDFPSELSGYSMIIHCGGCMLSDREIGLRYEMAKAAGVPMSNYGIVLAQINGILKRCRV